jgi:hypothetical protein
VNRLQRTTLALVGLASILVAAIGVSPRSPGTVFAAPSPSFSIADVGTYGGEPSIVSDRTGRLYETTPQGGTVTYTSADHGATWAQVTTADKSSGDDCLATDQANAVYLCNLNGNAEIAPLQADVWKSVDRGQSWTRGGNIQAPASACGTSCNVFGVDRDWVAASIPAPYSKTEKAEVVLMYHDFYGPSQIWVNISHDGGATFGPPQNVLAGPLFTPGAIAGTVVAQLYTMCNTVPAGVAIAPPGTPHANRIYVAWIAADPIQNPTGCNISMAQAFHTFWIAYSDDNGASWTPQQAFDAGLGHDASTPFVGFTLDNQGNPYFGFAVNLNSNPAVCPAKQALGTLQSDPSCEYDMYVVWSNDGGTTWDGGGGAIPGSAKTAYRVNPVTETGTHVFPAIVAGDPGNVEVAYLRTTFIEPTDSLGKFVPGGCAGPSTARPNYPGPCPWNLYGAQSLNLNAGPANATWAVTQITPTMHMGDICNLGIACIPTVSNRHLLDFIQEALDPQGCAHIGYADDNVGPHGMLRAANQTSGCIPNSGQTSCQEGDGAGTFKGNRGDGDFTFDGDGCLDGDQDGADSQNRGDGKDFHSARVDSIGLDSLGTTLTMKGVGTSGGMPVSFVLVAVESTTLTPGSVTMTLSDGFVNSGLLTSGSIKLH